MKVLITDISLEWINPIHDIRQGQIFYGGHLGNITRIPNSNKLHVWDIEKLKTKV